MLKEATKKEHQQLEKKVVNRLKLISAPKHYADILSSFYRYFSILEQKIAPLVPVAVLPDYGTRRKTSLLKQDLEHYSDYQTDSCPVSTPEISNWLEAMGALYVMEGATLGGQVITHMLSDKHNIREGLSFFKGYGDQTFAMWQRFTNAIDGHITETSDQMQVVRAANETFREFSKIIHD